LRPPSRKTQLAAKWPSPCKPSPRPRPRTPLPARSTPTCFRPMSVSFYITTVAVLGIEPKEIKSIQWYQLLGEISVLLESQNDENKKLNEDLKRREERYGRREQEYRKHIDELQRELRVRQGFERDAEKKNKRTYKFLKGKLDEQIDGVDERIEKLKEEQEKDIIRKFNSELAKMKKKIEERKLKKSGESGAELKDRENELQHHLELITNIA